MEKDNLIRDKTFSFALEIIWLYKYLVGETEFVLSKQLLRSGTSIGANVEEAIGAHSLKDFIARLIIANKEARESRYWILLLEKSKIVEYDFSSNLKNIDEILNILTAIIKTSKRRLEIQN